jgi:cytochrome c oxidase cbb3-type subunit 4
MYKDILRSITGIETFPVVSLLLFVTVFTAVLISVVRMDRRHAEALAMLPLDETSLGHPVGEEPR